MAGIYIATGMMSGSNLTIADVRRCDESMELADAIVDSRGPWALDFPFALPSAAYPAFSLRDWQALLGFIDIFEKAEIGEYLYMAGLHGSRDRCQRPDDGCRLTDAESGAFSPLKRYWPDRLGMTCEGLKLLGHLRRHGVSVYPFDELDPDRVRVYEVEPSNTRTRVGLGGRAAPRDFVETFNSLDGRAVELSKFEDLLPPAYDLNAVVSCATLANAIRAFDLDRRWDAMPANVTPREWEARQKEGLIVRL